MTQWYNYQYKHKLNYYNGLKTFGSPVWECVSSSQLELSRTWWWRKIVITIIIITALYFTLNEPWKAMSAKLKNPAFSFHHVTAINQIINVLNAAIKQYCLVVLIMQRWHSRTILCAIRRCVIVICSILWFVFKNVSIDERTHSFKIDNWTRWDVL